MPGYLDFFKTLQVSKIIHGIRETVHTKQQLEYPENIKAYLANITDIKTDQPPFNEAAFATEPDQIKQIKNLLNGLYYLERVFKKLELAPDAIVSSILGILGLQDEAYKASHLLTHVGVDVISVFQTEIADATNYISMLHAFAKGKIPQTLRYAKHAHSAGRASGWLIEQMNPQAGSLDYDLIGYVTSTIPKQIEKLRGEIASRAPSMKEYVPHANPKMLEALFIQRGQAMADTLQRSNQTWFSLIGNLPSLIEQLFDIVDEIKREAGSLDEGVQALIRTSIATLKYVYLPQLLALVDKIELQLMLKPGRLSNPLMAQIKSLYTTLIQVTRDNIDYEEHDGNLLHLEDARFLACRLQPVELEKQQATLTLNKITLVLEGLERCVYSLGQPDEQNTLKKHFQKIKPYLNAMDPALTDALRTQLYPQASYPIVGLLKSCWTNTTVEPILEQWQAKAQQAQTDQTFAIKQREAMIASVHLQAHLSLLPYRKTENRFEISEREVLQERYLLHPELSFMEDTKQVENLAQLTHTQAWDLHQAYQDRLDEMERVEKATDTLLEISNAQLQFPSPYTLCLDSEDPDYKHDHIYLSIHKRSLHYNARLASPEGCNMYLMSLSDAQKANHSGCYVWDRQRGQLSYIAPDGKVKENIEPINAVFLNRYLRFTQKTAPQKHCKYLDAHFIEKIITSKTQHRPVIVHRGTIPLKQLNCRLKELIYTAQMTPYVSRMLSELFERRHIDDAVRATCLRTYATLQPYLASTESGRAFDRKAVNLLMGGNISQPSTPLSPFSSTEFKQHLTSFKSILADKKHQLSARLERYDETVRTAPMDNHGPAAKIADITQRILPDVAVFMQSLDPIQHRIDASEKMLFRIERSLLKALPDETRTQLIQMQIHHQSQRKYHRALLESVQTDKHVAHANETYALAENKALLYASPHYTPSFLADNNPPKEGQILLKSEGPNLHYALVHYGKKITGTMPLAAVRPRLKKYDEHTALGADILTSIMRTIYQQRENQILSNAALLSTEEALDLYQWYCLQERRLWSAGEAIDSFTGDTIKDSEKTRLYLQLRPFFRHAGLPVDKMDTMKKAIRYFKNAENRKGISDFFANQAGEIQAKKDHYRAQAERLEDNSSIDLLIPPKPEPLGEDRSAHLIKHNECSEALGQLKQALSEYQAYLNPEIQARLSSPKTPGAPYPSVDTLTEKLREPHQVVAIKRLMNLVYYLEKLMLELEEMSDSQAQRTYVTHVVNGYLAVAQALWLSSELSNDVYFNRFYREMLEKSQAIYAKLTDEVMHFVPKTTTKPELIPGLEAILHALYELPQRIKPGSTQSSKAQSEAKHTADRLNKIIQYYNENKMVAIVFNTGEIKDLLSELRDRVVALASATHDRVITDLEAIKTESITKIILAIDAMEDQWGLEPGLLSTPAKEILEQLYLGFIEPLVPNAEERVELALLYQNALNEQRIHAAGMRLKTAESQVKEQNDGAVKINNLLTTYNNSKTHWSWDQPTYILMNEQYQLALPYVKKALIASDAEQHFPRLKHRLEGCKIYFMTPDEARAAKHTDCLVWFWTKNTPTESQLVYIPADSTIIQPIQLAKPSKFMAMIKNNHGVPRPEINHVDNKTISISNTEIHDFITKNQRHALPRKNLPFQLTDADMGDLDTLLPEESTIEQQQVFVAKIKRLLPMLTQCKAYYDGTKATAELAILAGNKQIDFLKAKKAAQKAADNATKRAVYDNYYQDKIASLTQSPWNALGYPHDLEKFLMEQKTALFDTLDTPETPAVVFSTAIDTLISEKKTAFDSDNSKFYEQLNQLRLVLDEFNAYLEQAEKNQALFENADTLESKRSILNEIERIIEQEIPAQERVEDIRRYLEDTSHINSLLSFNKYQEDLWSKIQHWVVALLTICRLYTPEFIRHIENICATTAEDATAARSAIHKQGLFTTYQMGEGKAAPDIETFNPIQDPMQDPK